MSKVFKTNIGNFLPTEDFNLCIDKIDTKDGTMESLFLYFDNKEDAKKLANFLKE